MCHVRLLVMWVVKCLVEGLGCLDIQSPCHWREREKERGKQKKTEGLGL